MASKGDKLTTREEQTCQDYITTGNKTEAIRRNYKTENYSENALNVQATKFFKKPKIVLRIDEIRKKMEDESILNAQQLQQFWTKTILDNGEEMKDRLKSSELLGKCIGAFEKDNKQKATKIENKVNWSLIE